MMLVFFEMLDLAAIRTLLVTIPESVGLLVFGITLAAAAVLIRWFLGRGATVKSTEKIGKKA